MRHVILDTGPIVALFDRDDRYHAHAVDWIRELGAAELITTAPVITEAMYVLPELRMTGDCLDWLSQAVSVDNALDRDLMFIRASWTSTAICLRTSPMPRSLPCAVG